MAASNRGSRVCSNACKHAWRQVVSGSCDGNAGDGWAKGGDWEAKPRKGDSADACFAKGPSVSSGRRA
eukprot:1330194-Alexandrium_andersonii.AAC.1